MKKREQQRREQLLQATFEAVADKGYSTVTLQDISTYAGVSKGVTNYYFKNKEDVFANLLEWLTQKIYQKEASAVQEAESAEEKLQAYVNAVFVGPKENDQFYKVYLDFLSYVPKIPRFQEINQHFYSNCFEIGKSIILRGKEEGIFLSVNSDQGAKAIRSLIDGCILQWLMAGDHQLHEYYKTLCSESIYRLLND
ncbi:MULTISPECIES: TetR/AcrR family transcriptional regulator [Pontibacillus]|uniref:TetR/AcrR family transcriptional regulator n=1 Tax=Pontibacillus chungwhensis TaxID=265426 RepID=A0ABY8V528_9BACI|nr:MULTISPECIES: TetR/AcrR family transcriptional regulator [Pontibacillus]MCD5322399.1 TetR/AcrR family transcriptional regulator [Pontibacillus sp. HN14]WIF99685.1 TetR/AcrR family transcriptional regulator [Pontibacillus chungwhensis]